MGSGAFGWCLTQDHSRCPACLGALICTCHCHEEAR